MVQYRCPLCHTIKGIMQQIKKRTNEIIDFNKIKIFNAISQANLITKEIDTENLIKLTNKVVTILNSIYQEETPTVENIQDLVIQTLRESTFKQTYELYKNYRKEHQKIRDAINKRDINLINKYIEETDWKVKENSNVNYSLSALNQYVLGNTSKNYLLNKI